MFSKVEEQEHGRVLVLDDEKNIVTVLKAILEKRGFDVDGFTDPREALVALRKGKYEASITDLYMPEIDGMAFLEEAHRLYPSMPVVMITAFGTVDIAVDAIKKGAFDFVTKPFEQSEIVSVIQKAVNTARLKWLSYDRTEAEQFAEIERSAILSGKSPAMQTVQQIVRKVATTPSVLLVLGEQGTGKEFLADEVHRLSNRAFEPLIKVNCAAVSSMNLDTEIFGGQKPGRLELADKGTLFLDEISDMNKETQQKLFDFLEAGTFQNPLTNEQKKADVRLIVACHKDLAKEVKEGRFREDLYYKLNVTPVTLPPLRERKDDLPALTDFFLRRLNRKNNKAVQKVDADALDIFSTISWPGNLRQLEQVLEKMVLLSNGKELTAGEIPKDLQSDLDTSVGADSTRFREIIRRQTQNLEKDLIEKALQEMDGNVTKTAEYLGISRKGLQLKLKELGIKQGERI